MTAIVRSPGERAVAVLVDKRDICETPGFGGPHVPADWLLEHFPQLDPRRIVYLTLCAVSNYIRKPTRPEWIAHRDFAPIAPVSDDALLNYARVAASKVAAE